MASLEHEFQRNRTREIKQKMYPTGILKTAQGFQLNICTSDFFSAKILKSIKIYIIYIYILGGVYSNNNPLISVSFLARVIRYLFIFTRLGTASRGLTGYNMFAL